jgi:hypothetical protein
MPSKHAPYPGEFQVSSSVPLPSPAMRIATAASNMRETLEQYRSMLRPLWLKTVAPAT